MGRSRRTEVELLALGSGSSGRVLEQESPFRGLRPLIGVPQSSEPAPAPAGPSNTSQQVCAICLEVLEDEVAVPLACTHKFHAQCVIPWLQGGNRSCPTCRNKPARQLMVGSDSQSDASWSEDGHSDDEEHMALHDRWDQTWAEWLETVKQNEEERRKALTRAKRLAKATRPRDAQAGKEARNLLKRLSSWQEKAKGLTKEVSVAAKTLQDKRMRMGKKQAVVHRWYQERVTTVIEQREKKLGAIADAANLPELQKEMGRMKRGLERASKATREAESKLARTGGWKEPGPMPQLPEGLRDCLPQPTLDDVMDELRASGHATGISGMNVSTGGPVPVPAGTPMSWHYAGQHHQPMWWL